MNKKLAVKSFLLAPLTLASLATVFEPAWAETEKEPAEHYRARAYDVNRGGMTSLDIVIHEWTTPEERQALFQTLADRGTNALSAALRNRSVKGHVKLPQILPYEMQYAWQVEVNGQRRIVLATDSPMEFLDLTGKARSMDRSMEFLDLTGKARSMDHHVNLVVLELNPETGQGKGTAEGGVELSIDKETGWLRIDVAGTKPTRLTKVKSASAKKKK